MNNKSFLIGSILVIVLAIISGIFTIGGPFQARKDRFDALRLSDLVSIAKALTCGGNSKKLLPGLPDKLNRESFVHHCKNSLIQPKTFIDKETNRPYKYTRIDARKFKVCAEFYNAKKTRKTNRIRYNVRITFDTKTGCVNGNLGSDS